MKNMRLCVLLALPVLFAQTPPPPTAPAGPTDEQKEKIIAQIREAALAWELKLGDFTCNRTSRLEGRTVVEPKAAVPKKPAAPPAAKTASATVGSAVAGSPATASKDAPKTVAKSDAAASPKPAGSGMILGEWQTLRLTEDRVIYSGHKDSYSSGARNGNAATAEGDPAATPGKNAVKIVPPLLEPAPISSFAGFLTGIFSENAHAELTWKGIAGLRGIPVIVLDYKVAKENSTQELVAGASRAIVGYHGTLYADNITHRVMSASFEADTPADFPEQSVQRLYDFGQVVIAGQFNLLPIKCQMQVRCSLDMLREGKAGGKSSQVYARLTTDFLSYHKYTAPPIAPPAQLR